MENPTMVRAALRALRTAPELSLEEMKRWYQLMHLGRTLDERAPGYAKQGLGWPYHAPCAGHDGIQLALGMSFRPRKDFLFPYYRDLLTCLAAGLSPFEILLNGLGKAADVASGGRNLSSHFAKPEIGIENVSSCAGNQAQHAVGLARAIRNFGGDSLVYCSLGEACLSEGYVYEAFDGASREKLPVIFVVQDNSGGLSAPDEDQAANGHACDNFAGFPSLRILKCDGGEPLDCMGAMKEAIAYVGAGRGAAIVNARCVRLGCHSDSDRNERYRDPLELAAAKAADPLPRFRDRCLQKGVGERDLQSLEEENLAHVLEAHGEALKSPDPDPASVLRFVCPESWMPEPCPEGTSPEAGPAVTLLSAIDQTLKEEFRLNPDTFMWGQHVAGPDKGGAYNVTKGMQQEFGPKRVFNAPMAEDCILGTANGFARFSDRIRIVVEGAGFAGGFWAAAEQLVELSQEYWRTNGKFCPNVTIRLSSGGYDGGGPSRSQNLEGWLAGLPGLRVVAPAFADDAAGLLRTALRSRGVTVFLEPRFLYGAAMARAHVPAGFAVPFGRARVRREGDALTLLAYGTPVHFALEASKQLEERGHSVEVLDLRSLNPLDMEGILQSVRKTHRALVVHEDKVFGGFGGEIAAQVADQGFPWLDAPVGRVGGVFAPVASSPVLERAVLPDAAGILAAALKVLSF